MGNFKLFVGHILNFMEGSVPLNYLGMPIFFGKPRTAHLQAIADMIIGKFNRWSESILSIAGRACLINSVITSSLTHSMMVYRWPRALLKSIDVAMRNFLWNGNISKQNYGTIPWSRVCAPRTEDGFGIQCIRATNE